MVSKQVHDFLETYMGFDPTLPVVPHKVVAEISKTGNL